MTTDVHLTEQLVQEIDVWLNTPPRRPWEAYAPKVGWALEGMIRDAEVLYTLLEYEMISEFYTRDMQGFPMLGDANARKYGAVDTALFY
jgi:glycogen phosphorylase